MWSEKFRIFKQSLFKSNILMFSPKQTRFSFNYCNRFLCSVIFFFVSRFCLPVTHDSPIFIIITSCIYTKMLFWFHQMFRYNFYQIHPFASDQPLVKITILLKEYLRALCFSTFQSPFRASMRLCRLFTEIAIPAQLYLCCLCCSSIAPLLD